jgi:hypothetical protein
MKPKYLIVILLLLISLVVSNFSTTKNSKPFDIASWSIAGPPVTLGGSSKLNVVQLAKTREEKVKCV